MSKKLLFAALILLAFLAVVSIFCCFQKKTTASKEVLSEDFHPSSVPTAFVSPNGISCPEGFVPIVVRRAGGGRNVSCSIPAIENPPIGTGKERYEISGYYSTYDRPMYTIDGPSTGTTTCKTFVITGGDSAFIKTYKDMVIGGNTVNRLDDNGNLALNIDVTDILPSQKNQLFESTSGNPVTLLVKAKVLGGRDAAYCESFIRIVSVE